MTTVQKYFIGSYVKNEDSIKQKNGTYKSQKKFQNLKTARSLWDFPIHTDMTLENNRPDITVSDKKSKKFLLIDPTCPFDTLIEKKEQKCTN